MTLCPNGRKELKRKDGIMTRNLKALGLALGVVFAFSAAMASTASGEDVLTVEKPNTAILTGQSTDNIFEITGKKISFQCDVSKFASTVKGSGSEATVLPTYYKTTPDTKCKSTIGEVTIDVNGCDYDLTSKTDGKDGAQTDAKVSITCPVGKEIEITGALGCTIKVPEQTPTEGGVVYENGTEGGKKDLTVKATATGITYTTTNVCTLVGLPTEGNDADYKGTVTVKGFEDLCEPEECPINGDEFKEGARVDIEFSES
jgi:hypothetical protein